MNMSNNWYKIEILGKEVNWASVVASGVLFIGLEIWRRKYIQRKITQDVNQAISSANIPTEKDESIIDSILERI